MLSLYYGLKWGTSHLDADDMPMCYRDSIKLTHDYFEVIVLRINSICLFVNKIE